MPLPPPALRKPSRACCAWPIFSPRRPHRVPPACRPGWQLGMVAARPEPLALSAQEKDPPSIQPITALTVRKRPAWMSKRAWAPVSRMRNTVSPIRLFLPLSEMNQKNRNKWRERDAVLQEEPKGRMGHFSGRSMCGLLRGQCFAGNDKSLGSQYCHSV